MLKLVGDVMKKTFDLVKDSIFCAIVSVFIILLNLLTGLTDGISTLVIIVFIGCYFQNKTSVRAILSSLVILLISFLVVNPINVLIFILTSLILGNISCLFLKKISDKKIFYIILGIVFFGVNFTIELLYAKFIMNMDFFTYIIADDLITLPDYVNNLSSLIITIYTILIAIISFMEVVILRNCNILYKRRIMKIIGEKSE